MKVLIVNGSPHPHGCVSRALQEIETELNNNGIETEVVMVGNKDIRGCIGCQSCKKTGKCVFDDLVNQTAPKFEEADGLVVGAPVHYGSPCGTVISFMDRLFYSTSFDKSFKVGAAVVSARRGGTTASFDVLNKYFTISNMPIASGQYWNAVHGNTAEEVEEDAEGLQQMRTVAKNMAFLIKSIDLGKKEIGLPEKEKRAVTNFIR